MTHKNKEAMWPTCIKNLSPIEYALETGELPQWIRQAFNREGIFNEDEMVIPIRPVSFLGNCSMAAYIDCRNTPKHHIERYQSGHRGNIEIAKHRGNIEIATYYWFDFDIFGSDAKLISLRMVVNEGNADCNDGHWGAVWERNTKELVADILSTGDMETTIKAVSEKYI
ncbi:MAG: hypothetical protein V7L14_24015 [Nostoc sp.]